MATTYSGKAVSAESEGAIEGLGVVRTALVAAFSIDVLELLLGREDFELLEVLADDDELLLDALFRHC